jgi:hypothetical protein
MILLIVTVSDDTIGIKSKIINITQKEQKIKSCVHFYKQLTIITYNCNNNVCSCHCKHVYILRVGLILLRL